MAIGGVLSQGELPNDKPIQYISKVLNSAQQNYSTIERELYAIIYTIDALRHYLVGFEFILYRDHRPLVYLFNMKNPSSRLYHWRLLISEYRFKIMYKKGLQNVVAAALSRINTELMDLNDFLDENGKANMFALTRSKTRAAESAILEANNTQIISDRKNAHHFYEIKENNDIVTNCNNFDHVFYFFFFAVNCALQKTFEHRTKSNIEFPADIVPLNPHSLNSKQTIFIFPTEMHTDLANMKLVFNIILQLCKIGNHNDIALNIDICDVRTYFEFQYEFKEIFKNSNIRPTFYLCKTIDVSEMDHILDILNAYHNSSLAGHASFEKTKNSNNEL